MVRCAALALASVALGACGSMSSSPGEAGGGGKTIGGIELKQPGVPAGDVFVLAREHGVRLDELRASYDFGDGDYCNAGFPLRTDRRKALKRTIADYKASVSDALGTCFAMNRGNTREERVRISARRRRVHTDPGLVMSFQASGTAGDLKSLADDPRVEAVFVKP